MEKRIGRLHVLQPLWTVLLLCAMLLIVVPQVCRGGDPAAVVAWVPEVWQEFQQQGISGARLPDFSNAGYHMGRENIPERSGPVFDVTSKTFGALPDDGKDDTAAIQAAVEAAGQSGGGVVFLPAGRYDIRTARTIPPIRITGDNVILRGAIKNGVKTTLYQHTPAPDGPVRRLGSVTAAGEARSGAAISVVGGEDRFPLAEFTADLKRGERIARVNDTAGFTVNEMVVIECTDPAIDSNSPAPEKTDLVRQLTSPSTLTEDLVDTFGTAARTVTWLTRIEKIIDSHTVLLAKHARFDHFLRYHPRILRFGGVREVGVENLDIACAWSGGYRHHKPFTDERGAVIRIAREQDYLWNGLWFSNAVDSWIRNVSFKDLTQGIIISHCADLSVREVAFHGQDGHAGITIGRSNDVLVSGADFYARLVHPVTLTMISSGNVVIDATAHYQGRDNTTATDAVLDFHGLFPFENLFDRLHGFYICPGGDNSVLPHGGVRNVFWNIMAPAEMSCYVSETNNEFTRTYAYSGTSSKTAATMYEQLPQAFYIGITRQGNKPVTIGNVVTDRADKWVTVEGLNRPGLTVPSLYEAQLEKRRTHHDLSKN